MTPDPSFRHYNASDIDQIAAIEERVQVTPWPRSMFIEPLEYHRYFGFVLECETEIVGFYIAEFIAGEATLHNVAVKPAFQGRGLGKHLLQHLIEQCRDRKAEQLFLEVRESNTTARGLYESFGFEQVGLRKDYYRAAWGKENGLVLAKAF
ncbi:ribosomal protein S18-alanine N-acetyltransferase [Echinimonas agarilytica]|uniref:[Ribosomal protein bS18]-alanine N-acetyltransferase n=1 Tax=Echinimonas agarilytica TaxID=1215918 RepID=A0AA42B6L4_9GAMM|nr:ribosomal protein S18-alanine N-acetyltransferase [Echinimonas agarilytica]